MEGYDDEIQDEETVINEVLGSHPRARELRLMRVALEERLAGMRRERERTADTRIQAEIDARINEIRKQIAVIHQEEVITGFVEGSVRVTLHGAGPDDLD